MPEGVTAPAGPADPASSHEFSRGFQWPEEVPFTELAREFVVTEWAPTPAPGKRLEGQHLEVTGQSGSGKSYCLKCILQLRALWRDSAIIYICTKADDPTVAGLFELGWPRTRTFDEVRRHRQSVFWPETKSIGEAKDKFFEERIYDLLSRIWRPGSNTIVVFDEIGYVEALSRRLKKLIRQYWREARALGISVVASKQRPVGVSRDQHSESRWKIVFPPADEGDMDRFAELLGQPRDWAPVLRSLDQELHQFVLRNTFTKDTFISWVDFDVDKLPMLPDREEHPVYPRAARSLKSGASRFSMSRDTLPVKQAPDSRGRTGAS
jgi:hypothetical protein